MAMVDAIKTAYKDPFEPVFEKGLQKGSILNIESCIARSVIVTLAQDKTCKFWEYGSEIRGIYIFCNYFCKYTFKSKLFILLKIIMRKLHKYVIYLYKFLKKSYKKIK